MFSFGPLTAKEIEIRKTRDFILNNDYDSAYSILEIRSKNPDDDVIDDYLTIGNNRIKNKDYHTSINDYKKALNLCLDMNNYSKLLTLIGIFNDLCVLLNSHRALVYIEEHIKDSGLHLHELDTSFIDDYIKIRTKFNSSVDNLEKNISCKQKINKFLNNSI